MQIVYKEEQTKLGVYSYRDDTLTGTRNKSDFVTADTNDNFVVHLSWVPHFISKMSRYILSASLC